MQPSENTAATIRVMFVCLGNICRSPTAHGVFQGLVIQRGLQDKIEVASSGTGDWHIGHAPDKRASLEAKRRGYDLSTLRAQQIVEDDFHNFDYLLAMDKTNLADLQAMRPPGARAKLALFLDYSPADAEQEVPDPYYGGDAGFAHVFNLVERASEGLLQEISHAHFAP